MRVQQATAGAGWNRLPHCRFLADITKGDYPTAGVSNFDPHGPELIAYSYSKQPNYQLSAVLPLGLNEICEDNIEHSSASSSPTVYSFREVKNQS